RRAESRGRWAHRRSGSGRFWAHAHSFDLALTCLEPVEMKREALARQQRRHLRERQADDIRVRADDLLHKAAGEALDRVAAGLAAPLARGDVALDVLRRE